MAHVFSSFHIPSLLLPCPPSAEMEAITVNQSEISTGLNHRLLPSLSSTLLSADSSTSQIKILTRHTLRNTCASWVFKFFSGVWAKFQIPPLRSVMFAIKYQHYYTEINAIFRHALDTVKQSWRCTIYDNRTIFPFFTRFTVEKLVPSATLHPTLSPLSRRRSKSELLIQRIVCFQNLTLLPTIVFIVVWYIWTIVLHKNIARMLSSVTL